MQHLEVSCAVRRFFKSLGFKGLMCTGLHAGCSFLSGINETSIHVDIFLKNTQISDLMKIRPVEGVMFHAGGRTDGQTDLTKLIFAFLNFVRTSKNSSIVYCEMQLDHALITAFYHITSL